MTGVALAFPTAVESAAFKWRIRPGAAAAALFVLLAGCATVPPDAGRDARDPLERFNRHVFEFNEGLDAAVLKPLAEAYDRVLPVPVQECLANGFSNLREPTNALNNLLQGKPAEAVSDVCRFAVNTTVGLLGCFDVASRMGLEKHREDFGQTLGRWGVGNGPFLVLPLLGPSTVRDTAGLSLDTVTDVNFWVENVRVRNTLFGLRTVSLRHELLKTDALIAGAALDKYTFIRDGYLQRRRSLVHDGNPPRAPDDDDDEDEEEAKPAAPEGSPGPPRARDDVKPSPAPRPAQ